MEKVTPTMNEANQVVAQPLIHHQAVICCVAFGRFSLRRIVYTPQAALLVALQLTPY